MIIYIIFFKTHQKMTLRLWLRYFMLFLIGISTLSIARADELIIEPDQGRTPLLNAILHAQHTIDLVLYGFTDTRLANALIRAQHSGKTVRVLIEPHPYASPDQNQWMIKRLKSQGITIHFASNAFTFLHQKTLVIDHRIAWVMTFNWTRSAFSTERNHALILTDPVIVDRIQAVFNADWMHQPLSIQDPHLIYSPDHARAQILTLIQTAQSSLDIETQSLTDYQTIGALARAARHGIHIRILTSDAQKTVSPKKWRYLEKSGISLHFNKQYDIHTKIIIIDKDKALIGSTNLTPPSLLQNRELSALTDDPNVLKKLIKNYETDWTAI